MLAAGARKLGKRLPLAAIVLWVATTFPFTLVATHFQAVQPVQCWQRTACRAFADDADDSSAKKGPLEVPWWQLEDQAERLMAPRMPFRVEQVSPPPVKKLGYALLDARTTRGDVINMEGTDRDNYVVSKVRFLYDLVGGRYRIRTKVLEVQTPKRYKINEKLAGLVNDP
mmetsp:Transcript_51734/g.116043  ORF Transcript_51734/g.116043 Transcript_51734/m.116043 type:complete len:170 (+) Transcript_51734:28-537(+)